MATSFIKKFNQFIEDMISMFENLFSNKEEPKVLTIKNLETGCIFEYDLRTWKVEETYEYDWGDHFFTREYKISDGSETAFLHVEDDDELELLFSKPVSIRKIDKDLGNYISNNQETPDELSLDGKKYYLDGEHPGYFRNLDKEEHWTEFISWDYYDEEEKSNLCVEQWGEKSFEASQGHVIKEYQISNILPKPEKN